ncbi:hypothetical protein PG997_005595 [Apiospora hydei]|uniref:Large ribosomal subunit protein mL50 n=1 Tax=Apiospora hydei TaxID=1337664 RepID=A0ABR1WLB1_9PEZI
MRRISRLGKPSGARLAPTARPLAPLCTPRAAAATRPSPTPAAAVTINTLRFYSSRQPEPLPASLTSGKSSAAPRERRRASGGARGPGARPPITTAASVRAAPAALGGGTGRYHHRHPVHARDHGRGARVDRRPGELVGRPGALARDERLCGVQAQAEGAGTGAPGGGGAPGAHGNARDEAAGPGGAADWDLGVDSDGTATVTGDLHAVADGLVVKEGESIVGSADILPSAAEALAWKQQADQSWKGTSLQDARLKFAVIKRVMQLTGQVVPDQKLANIATAREIETKKQDLVTLPNVAFSPKRVTRGHKDQALGRYKLIEAEFRKRDLQDGPLSVPKSREKKHWNGEA